MELSGTLKWFGVVCIAFQCFPAVLTAKILALCHVPSPSHSLWCYQYLAALSEKGHQITVLGVDKPKIEIANLTSYIANSVYDTLHEQMDISAWSAEDKSKINEMHPGFTSVNEIVTRAIMASQELEDLLKKYKDVEKPFDLIIHDNTFSDALLGLVPLFGNPPLLLATTYSTPQWMVFRAGNTFNPAYVPSMITVGDQHMTFYERCVNTFYYLYTEYSVKYVMEPLQDELMRERFGNDLPDLLEIVKRANVVIVNYHFAWNGPRPLLPGVIGIAGLHITDPKPLPQDIKEFMDGAKDGVILLSFGTNIDSQWFSKGFERMILSALAQLPQRVLWKWDKILPNLPNNVKMSTWLPQGDMLAHPKMCLFISHCGLLSTQEAIYRKVRILALPVFLDQLDNADMLVKLNLTFKLSVHQLTSDKLVQGINEILSNSMYKTNIEKMGELMADTPLTSKQLAVYWTEYAIRHQGAPHLRSASADMPWYQLLLLDVLGLALLVALVAGWIIKVLFFVLRNLLFGKSKTKKD